MRQIGGPRSMLYSLNRSQADAVLAAMSDQQIPTLVNYSDEGQGGALVWFREKTDIDAVRRLFHPSA